MQTSGAIHDYEGFGDIRIEEYTALTEISELAAFLAEHGVAAYLINPQTILAPPPPNFAGISE